MKDIKFRCWTPWNNRMMLADELRQRSDMPMGMLSTKSNFNFMQFSGLYDENDIEIYEDDLVEDTDGNIGKVCFEAGMFIIGTSSYEDHWKPMYDFFNHYTDSSVDLKVVGNIHQNKEMYNG